MMMTTRSPTRRVVIIISVSRPWTACSESNYCEQQRCLHLVPPARGTVIAAARADQRESLIPAGLPGCA
jgi:hypothetical protein